MIRYNHSPIMWTVTAVIAAAFCARPAAQDQVAKTPIVMSSAGGISKGSYQAGVDWTISEYLRRQRSPKFRTSVRDLVADVPESPKHDLAEFDLRSATGASAGNINAVFAALGWCTQTFKPSEREAAANIQAEDSLFWRTWVNTGTPSLLPEDDDLADSAALSRQVISTRHFDSIWKFMQAAVPLDAGCSLPVGITLTRLEPVTIPIGGRSGSIGVQRFASIFNVVSNTSDRARPRLDFSAVRPELAARGSLGALALLPALGRSTAVESIPERLREVFGAMLASSAFPVAFAPREVRYRPGGLLPPLRDNDESPTALFSDGGVFDNNPIGLAVRLAEPTGRGASDRPHKERLLPIRVAYSSPGNFRKDLLASRKRALSRGQTESSRSGLGGAKKLLEGAFGAARDYELQSLRRQIERDFELNNREMPTLLVSSRSAPIVGESVHSFGAFLGRSLREYDFYTGIYDGLEFVARNFVCGTLADGEKKEKCTDGVHARFVRHNVMRVEYVAHELLKLHVDGEYDETSVEEQKRLDPIAKAWPDVVPGDDERRRLLTAIYLALPRAMPECSVGGDLVESLLCDGGLGVVLKALAKQSDAVQQLNRSCKPDQHDECPVDDDFYRLIAAPRAHLYRLVERAVRNVERAEKKLPLPAKIASSVFRSSTLRYQRGVHGFVFFPSSAAIGDSLKASVAGIVVPSYVHQIWLGDYPDATALGWQPLRGVWSDHLFVNTQVELFIQGTDLATFTHWSQLKRHLGAGVSLGTAVAPRLPVLGRVSSMEVGLFRLPDEFPMHFTERGHRALRFATRAFLDKFQLTVLVNRRMHSISIGLSDLNGFAYWLIR